MSDPTRVQDPAYLGEALAADHYLRSRLQPRRRQGDYLILRDILALLEPFARGVRGRLFDYGSGGAPYRALFPGITDYVRADVTPGPQVDRLLASDGRTEEPEASYDAVLSTQVLEHVAEPAVYLAECRRILRPGGRLFLTTHGMFEEHGCPYDFHRWTGRGLVRQVAAAGLEIQAAHKLCTQFRAVIQLQHYLVAALRQPDRPLIHYPLAVLRAAYFRLGVPVSNWLADAFPSHALASTEADAVTVYVGVAVEARKARTVPPGT
ncbi:MAG: class I SAM-dependent methyltransferase [Limisphaerales bacterium]